MKNEFNAICSHAESDHIFFTEIISQICDYAVDHNMKPNDTIKTIANNMLMLTEIATFDDWSRRPEK